MAIKSNRQGPRISQQFVLPSGGFRYNGLLPGGKVVVHAFNFDAEQILAGDGDGLTKMSAITPIIADLPGGLPIGNLLSADQFYIVLAARSMSFGVEYSFGSTCPTCGKRETHKFELPDGLPVNRLKEDFQEPFEIELPTSGDKVGLKFLTVNDEMAVANYARQKKLNSIDPGDPGYKFRLAKHIVYVNDPKTGVPADIQEAIDYVTSLDGKDPYTFRRGIEQQQPGVAPLITVQCPDTSCNDVYEITFKMTPEFFRPKR